MKRAMEVSGQARVARLLPNGVSLIVLFIFLAWSLRVAFVSFDTLSDLTLAGVLNEVLRAVIFVGSVLVYPRYIERASILAFLKMNKPRENTSWVLLVAGALFVGWYLLLDGVIGDGRIGGTGFALVLFTLLSPATLVEEIYFRGFLLNKFWQVTGF